MNALHLGILQHMRLVEYVQADLVTWGGRMPGLL